MTHRTLDGGEENFYIHIEFSIHEWTLLFRALIGRNFLPRRNANLCQQHADLEKRAENCTRYLNEIRVGGVQHDRMDFLLSEHGTLSLTEIVAQKRAHATITVVFY